MDIYIRVSQLRDRDEDEATRLYEVQCREWAERHDIAVGRTVKETDVSGATAVRDRELERLIRRVEAGESDGIITPNIARFGRDMYEGLLAYRRVQEAGGRLVAVESNLDSKAPNAEFTFNILMSVAQEERRQRQVGWRASVNSAAERGVYLAAKPPFGYRRGEDGSLEPDPDEEPLVHELFRRRARGANYGSLYRWLKPKLADLPPDPDDDGKDRRRRVLTKRAVAYFIQNRSYLGEMKVQTERKGFPRVQRDNHPPLVTEAEWNAAQIKPPYVSRNGTASDTELVGLAYCATCGKRMKTGLSGPKDRRLSSYVCANPDCEGRASIRTNKLDAYAARCLNAALFANEPHVKAILMDDSRYQTALAEVQEARQELADWEADVEVYRRLGRKKFLAGIDRLEEKVRTADRALAEVPSPQGEAEFEPEPEPEASDEQAEQLRHAYTAEQNRRFIWRVEVAPVGRGYRRPAEDRARLWWVGADQPYELPKAPA